MTGQVQVQEHPSQKPNWKVVPVAVFDGGEFYYAVVREDHTYLDCSDAKKLAKELNKNGIKENP